MQFDNQKTRNVADAAAKILAGETVSEELKGNQHKIDANKNGKIDKQDFEMLRKEKGVKQEASCGKMRKEETELTESHFKVGDEVKCKASGMTGKVVKLDKEHGEEDDKYYTVKREDGKEMKYAPKELSLVKEENLDEATPSRQQVKQAIGIARDKRYAGGNMTGAMKAMNKINKGLGQHPAVAKELKKQNEEVEQLDEYTPSKTGVTKIQGRAYGASKPEKHAVDTMSGPTRKQLSAIEKEKKKPFKEMLELYAEKGLKALSEMTMTEEPDQETFEKELEMAKKKATQKKTPEEEAGVAKAAVQSVKVEEEVEQINERPMTDAEMDKREDIVKGMKKNLKGFKDRYGDRAKSVMYATATKTAMKDED